MHTNCPLSSEKLRFSKIISTFYMQKANRKSLDNFDWQDEFDMVCRKFYKYLKTKH